MIHFFYKSWFTFDLILVWDWIIHLLFQLYHIATFNNYLNKFVRKRGGARSSLENDMTLVHKKQCLLFCLVPVHYTFTFQSVCLWSKIILVDSSGVLYIVKPPMACQCRLVTALPVYWLFGVLWKPLVTNPYYLLACQR